MTAARRDAPSGLRFRDASSSLPLALRVALPLLAAAALVGLWQVAVTASGTKIFPSPFAVVKALAAMSSRGVLRAYIADSLFRVAAGYLSAVIAGVALGLLLGMSPRLSSAINPLIQMLRPISPLAWMPLAVIWFGVSNLAPIFLIFLASFFPIAVTTMTAVRNVPAVYIQSGRNFGLGEAALIWRVVLPAVLPRILVGLRIAFGVAWLVLVAAEMIAVDSGLGYLIIDARNAGKRYDLVVGGMLLIGVIGLLLDTLLRTLERIRSLRWGFGE
jgi:NitT/TauT family transport system permease protein